jgi:hypothetical protein
MVTKLVLALQRWIALRHFRRGAAKRSYIYFDYYVSLGGASDRVRVHAEDSKTHLLYESTDPCSGQQTSVSAELDFERRNEMFDWLRQRFPNGTKVLRIMIDRDPARLRLFARDTENGWECLLSINDVSREERLRYFRGDFIEQVKRCVPAARGL